MSDDDSDKPRRLEDATAEYLMKVELQFSDDLPQEDKLVLVENVILEIAQRTASAASDRRTNYLIEKICYAADLKNLLIITKRFAPYVVFLARNRFSSHVLQAVLARLCYILKFEDFGDIDSGEIKSCVENLCGPFMKEISWLILEQNATHVVRSAMSLLAGMPVIAERKSKNSKHQHSIALSMPLEALLEPDFFYVNKAICFSVPDSFQDILIQAVESLIAMSTADLEKLLADFSSSAVLGLLVRVLCSPNVLHNHAGPKLAQRLFAAALGWSAAATVSPADARSAVQGAVPDSVQGVFYAMAGDKAGSYFLEALIECAPLGLLLGVVRGAVAGRCKEYVADGSGNFVLQAVLRRVSCELARLPPSAPTSVAADLIDLAKQFIDDLMGFANFTELVNLKGGVTLWMLAVTRALDESYSERVGMGVIRAWVERKSDGEEKETKEEGDGGEDEQAQLSAFISVKLVPSVKAKGPAETPKNTKFVPKSKAPERGEALDTTQLLVARLLGALLRSRSPAVASLTARAFANITPECLKFVATSGAISRAVLDVYFEQFAGTTELKLLGISLAAIGVELAQHYVGQHIVRQFFDSADLRGKEKWAMTLSASREILTRTKEGLASLRLVNTELYSRDAAEWRNAIKRKMKAESLLKELDVAPLAAKAVKVDKGVKKAKVVEGGKNEVEGGGSKKEVGSKEGDKDDSDDEDEADGEGAKTARKRKRKRPAKKA